MGEPDVSDRASVTHTYALVEWIDSAWFDVGSYFKKDDPRIEPMHFESVGILIKDDADGIALATDYTPDRSGDDKYRDVMFVPRVAVVQVTRLGPEMATAESQHAADAHPAHVLPPRQYGP